MALVLYRKYRPQTFADIVGQEHVVQTLQNAVRLDRVGHAYLFVGPRGTGKTTMARLLAKAVNCENLKKENEPCTVCMHCASLQGGRYPDLIEIDAASNRGVDEIRELRESARVAPLQGERKIYVIDEAHMLTQPAVNALLKTLEEPPEHVIFVLATTDVEKLPVTITSRTQRFNFRTLSVQEITGRLKKLAKAEDVHIADDALELLAQAADGSIRDGESLLEQVLACVGEEISREDVMEVLGVPDPLIVQEIAGAVLSRDTKKALETVNEAIGRGVDATALAIRLASYLRDVLLLHIDKSLAPLIEKQAGSAHRKGAAKHAENADKTFLSAVIPKFIEAAELTKRSPIPQLPVELVIVEAAGVSVGSEKRERVSE